MNGNEQKQTDVPFISLDGVNSVLESIEYNDPKRCHTSMLSLYVVDLFLLDHQLPNSDRDRHFALTNLLVDLIESRYTALRASLTSKAHRQPQSKDDLVSLLINDMGLQSQSLTDWGILLSRYVYTNFEISQDQHASILGTSLRNLRRYRKTSINRLVDALIEIEWQARNQLQKLRLRASLPSFQSAFIGRSNELQTLERCCRKNSGNLILVTGITGIGKSHFVSTFLKRQVDQEQVKHIFWFSGSYSIEFIKSNVCERLIGRFSQLALSEFASVHRVFVVIDDAELLESQLLGLNKEFPTVDIIGIGNAFTTKKLIGRADCVIQLAEFTDKEARALHEQTLKLDGKTQDDIENYYPIPHIPKQIKLISRSHQHLPDNISFLAYGCALHPTGCITANNPIVKKNRKAVQQGFPEWITKDDGVKIPQEMKTELQAKLHTSKDAEVFNLQIEAITSNLKDYYHADTKLDIAETLLAQFVNIITKSQQERIITSLWKLALHRHRTHTWFTLIHEIDSNNPEILIACGNLCMRSGYPNKAEKIFMKAVKICGETGKFHLQHKIMVDVATNLRRQSKYTQAEQILNHIATRQLSPEIIQYLNEEQLRLYLETNNWRMFENTWDSISDQNSETCLAARCEYFIPLVIMSMA